MGSAPEVRPCDKGTEMDPPPQTVQMINGLILHCSVERRKRDKLSISNDADLQCFTVLATLEPPLYGDPDNGEPRTHQHDRWYAMMLSKNGAEVRTRHAFRAMLYSASARMPDRFRLTAPTLSQRL